MEYSTIQSQKLLLGAWNNLEYLIFAEKLLNDSILAGNRVARLPGFFQGWWIQTSFLYLKKLLVILISGAEKRVLFQVWLQH